MPVQTKPSTLSVKQLARLAHVIRQDVIEALLEAKSGHAAGALGMADIFTVLYFAWLRVDPKRPDWPVRDRVVLSNAHICPVLYATLGHRGFCSLELFKKTLRKFGSPFQGHSTNHFEMGIETCGGPLGQGLSQAVGMALAARMDRASWRTYCLLSDGEMDEGQTWEAGMLAAKEGLGTLTAIIDRNHIQIDGRTEDVMPLEPLVEKWRAFGWHALEVDGHAIPDILAALKKAEAQTERPTMIIAHTVPGKGVPFMENQYVWHGKAPNADEARGALHHLRTLAGRIRSEHE